MHSGDPTSPHARSYLSSDGRFKSPDLNPMAGIRDLINREGIKVDWVVCAGDIADRNNAEALRAGWAALSGLKARLSARLYGTVGNHDLDSRRLDPDEKPNSILKTLDPLFPTRRKIHCNDYWANDITSIDDPQLDARIVILNSCAFHGFDTSATVAEFQHGRVTREGMDRLRQIIKSNNRRKNVLLIHHHLRPHPQAVGDISIAVNGEALLELLRKSGQQWLVIHGHEHLSYLGYQGGTEHPPIIFSAGSLASTELRRVPGRMTTNQLYYIDLSDTMNVRGGTELYGEVRAWDWLPLIGWQAAHKDAGIPHFCGFGVRGQIDATAQEICDQVTASPNGQLPWETIWANVPNLRYLVPSDQAATLVALKRLGVVTTFGSEGVPYTFAKERHP